MTPFLINIMYIMSDHREPSEIGALLSYLYHVMQHIMAQPVARFLACGFFLLIQKTQSSCLNRKHSSNSQRFLSCLQRVHTARLLLTLPVQDRR